MAKETEVRGLVKSGAVLDTNAIILLTRADSVYVPPDGPFFVSVLSEIEALSYSELSRSSEQVLVGFFRAVTVVDLTSDIKLRAIQIRRTYRIKTPDAIIAATAISLNLPLLSHDRGLRKVEGLVVIELGEN